MHAFNTNRVQCLITSTNSLLKSYWDLGVIQKDRVAHESWKMRILCKRVPFAQSLWTLVFFTCLTLWRVVSYCVVATVVVCVVCRCCRSCAPPCSVLIPTGNTSTDLKTTQPQLGPGQQHPPPVSYSRTPRGRYCSVAKHYVGWGHGQMGSADPRLEKMDEKLQSENMQKRAVFYVYVIS